MKRLTTLAKFDAAKEWITLSPIMLSEIDEPSKEIQIAKIGKFKHPKFGEFEITQATLDEFVHNFDNNTLGVEISMNFEHGATTKFGTISAGSFKSLVSRDGKLFAVIEWTARALEHIKKREFKFISPEIFFQWANEVGKKFKNIISGAALTNTPWFKGMEMVKATEPETKGKPNMNLQELLAKLFSEFGINVKQLQEDAGKYLAEKLVFTESEGKVIKLTTDLATMTTRATDAEKKFGEVAFDALVKKGMSEGKLTKAQAEGSFKEVFEKMGAEFAEKFINDAPKVVDLTDTEGHGKGNDKKPDGGKFTAAETLVDNAKKLALEKGLNFSEAFAVVSLTDSSALDKYDEHVLKQASDEMSN